MFVGVEGPVAVALPPVGKEDDKDIVPVDVVVVFLPVNVIFEV